MAAHDKGLLLDLDEIISTVTSSLAFIGDDGIKRPTFSRKVSTLGTALPLSCF